MNFFKSKLNIYAEFISPLIIHLSYELFVIIITFDVACCMLGINREPVTLKQVIEPRVVCYKFVIDGQYILCQLKICLEFKFIWGFSIDIHILLLLTDLHKNNI
ncbi:hypothetical protein ACJX0J_022443 [Zea mays]